MKRTAREVFGTVQFYVPEWTCKWTRVCVRGGQMIRFFFGGFFDIFLAVAER